MTITVSTGPRDNILISGFSWEQIRFLMGSLERAKHVNTATDARVMSCAASVSNAGVIDSMPGVVWNCDKPTAPARKALAVSDSRPFLTPPMTHQDNTFELSKDIPAYALWWEMGLGKSWMGIVQAAYWFQAGLIDKVLVIAPSGVHKQWANQQIPEHCAVDNTTISWDADKNRTQPPTGKGLLFWCVNIDTFSVTFERKKGKASRIQHIRKWCDARTMIILDEGQNIKTPGSTRTGSVLVISQATKYKRILSGTPITKGTEDLYTQYKFLDPAIIGYHTYTGFVTQYCKKGGHAMRDIVGYQNIGELRTKLAPFTSRLVKEDCLSLPPKVMTQRHVEMSGEQKHWYKVIRDALKESSAANEALGMESVIEQLTRLRQILGGHVRPTKDGELIKLSCPKVDVLVNSIADLPGRVLVWAVHSVEIERIMEALHKAGRRCGAYYGKASNTDCERVLREYTQFDDYVFVSNPAKGGTGLNLDGAGHVFYFSHGFNAAHRWQSEDRTHRATTTRSVIYTDYISPGTLDAYILRSTAAKKGVSDMTIGELRELIAEL